MSNRDHYFRILRLNLGFLANFQHAYLDPLFELIDRGHLKTDTKFFLLMTQININLTKLGLQIRNKVYNVYKNGFSKKKQFLAIQMTTFGPKLIYYHGYIMVFTVIMEHFKWFLPVSKQFAKNR